MKYQEWREKIKPEKKLRNYQHIDDLIDLNQDKDFNKIVHIIKNIKNHQFLPFIKRVETVIRFRKNKDGKARRSSKTRPIMYASHVDSHIYSYYNFILMEEYENYLKSIGINDNVTAYRKVQIEETKKGKSNVHFAKEVFDYVQNQKESIVITQDIEGFFDNINHGLLKEKICKVKNVTNLDDSFFKVFKSLTRYKYIEYKDFENKKIKRKIQKHKYAIYKVLADIFKENKTNKGIPQGSPISGLFANISLVDFDNEIKTSFPNVFYRRYSDDLVFVCNKDQLNPLLQLIDSKIKESYLKINAKKSFITYFKKIDKNIICDKVTNGLNKTLGRNYVDYLGLEFNGAKTYLRKNTIQKLKHKQIKRATNQVSNIIKQKIKKSKKVKKSRIKTRSNYLKKAVEIVDNIGIKRQVLKVTKDRNKAQKLKVKSLLSP